MHVQGTYIHKRVEGRGVEGERVDGMMLKRQFVERRYLIISDEVNEQKSQLRLPRVEMCVEVGVIIGRE